MNIMIVGQNGRMNTLVAQQAAQRQWGVVVFTPQAQLQDKIDVVIDFSAPEAWLALDDFFKKCPLPLISGTTGLGEQHWALFHQWSQRQPVYHAPNFSPGIRALRAALQQHSWGGWEIEMRERHHSGKKDAPSGTALLLARDLGFDPSQIGVSRQGDHCGEHQVVFRRAGEQLVLEHQATSRDIFATGALDLAPWIKEQPPGVWQAPLL